MKTRSPQQLLVGALAPRPASRTRAQDMNPPLHSIFHCSWFNCLMISIILLAGLLAGLETNASVIPPKPLIEASYL